MIPVPFPDGFGATVHFLWPGKGFQLLGMFVHAIISCVIYITDQHPRLSNEKPSAIFRLRGTYTSNYTATQDAFTSGSFGQASPSTADVTAILGFSIEPLPQIQAQMTSMPPSNIHTTNVGGASGGTIVKAAPDATLLAERIVKNLFNYVSGFVPGGGSGMVTPDSVVPMGVIAKWYEKFLGKVKAGGVEFLEKQE